MNTNGERLIDPKIIRDFYRTPLTAVDVWENQCEKESPGFFRFGSDLVCYGSSSAGAAHDFRSANHHDAQEAVRVTDSGTYLPFQFSSVIENLRRERYVTQLRNGDEKLKLNRLVWTAYYAVREF